MKIKVSPGSGPESDQNPCLHKETDSPDPPPGLPGGGEQRKKSKIVLSTARSPGDADDTKKAGTRRIDANENPDPIRHGPTRHATEHLYFPRHWEHARRSAFLPGTSCDHSQDTSVWVCGVCLYGTSVHMPHGWSRHTRAMCLIRAADVDLPSRGTRNTGVCEVIVARHRMSS